MKNTQNKRTLTLQERHEQHRRNHPRDTISFREAPVEQPKAKKPKRPRLTKIQTKRNDLGPKTTPVDVVTTKPTQPNKTTPFRRLSGSRNDMIRCRECGRTTSRERVRTGDCHSPRYGKGDFGQGYSGNNGRGRLHGGHIERRR